LVCCALVGCVAEPTRAPGAEPTPPAVPAAGETAPQAAPPEPGAPAAKPTVAEQQGASGVPASEPAPEVAPKQEPESKPEPEEVWPEPKPKEVSPEPKPAEGSKEGTPAATSAAATPAPTAASWLHGSLSARYRGRFTSDDQDQEARGVLALDLADPRAPWISGHLLARMDVDLEGLDEGEVFQDLSDTYDGAVVSKLYLAYAD